MNLKLNDVVNATHHSRLILLITIFISIFLILSKVHGFSLPMWNERIGLPEHSGVVVGKPQAIRSDDWAVELPVILGQTLHRDFFPQYNDKFEMDMLVNTTKIPTRHPLQFFKPAFWGFFLGGDFGLSWLWVTLNAGCFLGLYFLFNFLNRGKSHFAAAGAMFFVVSPLSQYWSLHYFDIVAHGAFAAFFFLKFTESSTLKCSVMWLLGFSWMAIAFVINPYPPFQVVSGYFFLLLVCSYLLQKKEEILKMKAQGVQLTVFSVALLVVLAGVLGFIIEGKDTLRIISNTVYPGARMEVGGMLPFWRYFVHSLAPFQHLLSAKSVDWSFLGNVCEAAQVVFVLPFFLLAAVSHLVSKKENRHLIFAMLGFSLFLMIFGVVGFSRVIAEITFFSKVTATRSVIGVGLASAFFISFSGSLLGVGTSISILRSKILLVILSTCFIFLGFCLVRWNVSAFSVRAVNLALFVYSLLFALLCMKPSGGVISLVLISSYGLIFNPIVIGGHEQILKSGIGQLLLSIDRELNGNSKWASFGDVADSNFPRLLGLRTLNGTMLYPRFSTWYAFDPDRSYSHIYNRYAHFTLLADLGSGIEFSLPANESITVKVNPGHPVFTSVGVTHFLVRYDQSSSFSGRTEFCLIGGNHWYQVFKNQSC